MVDTINIVLSCIFLVFAITQELGYRCTNYLLRYALNIGYYSFIVCF